MNFIKKRIGPLISRWIMPAQDNPVLELKKDRPSFVLQKGSYEEYIRMIASTQDALIDVFEVQKINSHFDLPVENQKVFIHLHGEGACYETFKDHYRSLAQKYPGSQIVGFNCRNVQYSQGIATCENDWVDDAVAVIRFYQKKGIPLENIVLIGHSLGGAILTMAAARIYQEEITSKGKQAARSVKVFSNRSFSTLAHVVAERLSGGKIGGLIDGLLFGGIYITIKSISALLSAGILASLTTGLISSLYVVGITALFVGWGHIRPATPNVAKPFVRLIVDAFLRISFGRMDALSAYKLLPDNAKDHVMVKDDGVIPPLASLHYGLKPINSQKKKTLRERINAIHDALLVPDPANREALLKEQDDCRNALLALKDSKLRFHIDGVSVAAHNCDPGFLRTYHKNRGRSGMLGFLDQIEGNEVIQRKLARML